jgi:hypothetical protein
MTSTNQLFLFDRYIQVFVITVFVITEFDCILYEFIILTGIEGQQCFSDKKNP